MGTPDAGLNDQDEVLPAAQVEVGRIYRLRQLQPHMEFELVNPPVGQPYLQGRFQVGSRPEQSFYRENVDGRWQYREKNSVETMAWCTIDPETEVKVVLVPAPEAGLVR